MRKDKIITGNKKKKTILVNDSRTTLFTFNIQIRKIRKFTDPAN